MTSTMRFDKWENSLGQPYGTVLQVVQTAKTDTFTLASTTMTNITGLSATITPSSATSKILILMTLNVDCDGANIATGDVTRNGTQIGIGNAASARLRAGWTNIFAGANRQNVPSFTFLDSPITTSALTYQARIRSDAGTVYVNRTNQDIDTSAYSRTISTITLMEIAQ